MNGYVEFLIVWLLTVFTVLLTAFASWGLVCIFDAIKSKKKPNVDWW